jgi:hypothetical protein
MILFNQVDKFGSVSGFSFYFSKKHVKLVGLDRAVFHIIFFRLSAEK